MRWLRRHEGYLLIDHRDSPGVVADKAHPLGPSQVIERAVYTCSHCQRQVVVNPLRTRSRGYCPKCDHVICDFCEAERVASGGVCTPFKALVEKTQEEIVRNEQRARGSVLILP